MHNEGKRGKKRVRDVCSSFVLIVGTMNARHAFLAFGIIIHMYNGARNAATRNEKNPLSLFFFPPFCSHRSARAHANFSRVIEIVVLFLGD